MASKPTITIENIYKSVSEKSGKPLDLITGKITENILRLEEFLQYRIIGQKEAIKNVTRITLKHYLGLRGNPNRPLSILFAVPTGVGETEMAKAIAWHIKGDPNRLYRFDMNEYSQGGDAWKFLGSSPGFVGSQEEPKLTRLIREDPAPVVLFDEIEKADDKVLTSMLRLLDEGIISDNQGRELHFEDAVLILTTNAGSVDLAKEKIGFGCSTEDGTKILTQYFRPEFINRVNIVFFKSLIREDIYEIIRLKTGDILNRLDFSISINEDFYANVAENIVSTRMGAREVERAVEDELLTIASGNKNVLLSKTA